MPIVKQVEVGGSGVVAEYWVMERVIGTRVGNTSDFVGQARYACYLNKTAYEAGKQPAGPAIDVRNPDPVPGSLTTAELEASFDALAVQEGQFLAGGTVDPVV